MTIFISYALRDKELADKFANLLQLGAGIPHDDIFFSADAGSIPNGADFREQILSKLNGAGMVICLLSLSYFESSYCVAECGAALARKQGGKGEYRSFMISPFDFSDLPPIVQGIQSGKISDSKALAALREVITRDGTRVPGLPKWIREVEDFLLHAEEARKVYEADALAEKMAPKAAIFVRDSGKDSDGNEIYFKSKLRLIFENDTGKPLTIFNAMWEPAPGSLFHGPSPYLRWQALRSGVWTREVPKDPSIQIEIGERFRTYVGTKLLLNEEQLIQVIEAGAINRLGKVTINMTIGGIGTILELPI